MAVAGHIEAVTAKRAGAALSAGVNGVDPGAAKGLEARMTLHSITARSA